MLRTVHFDDGAMIRTGEIGDKTGNRHLPAETQAFKAMDSNSIPEL